MSEQQGQRHAAEVEGVRVAWSPRSVEPGRWAAARQQLGELAESVLASFASARIEDERLRRLGILASLADIEALAVRVDGLRDAVSRDYLAMGATLDELAQMAGTTRSAAQRRKQRLARETSPAEMWARGQYGPVDHPGAEVPGELRSWDRTWPSYLPVDVTPEELRPEQIEQIDGVAIGYDVVAEPGELGPEVWLRRSREAITPYECDSGWRPLFPGGRTGRTGRALRRWGENAAADAVVMAEGHVLLVRRLDVGTWALPGGKVEPGETPEQAAVRELAEEAALDLSDVDTTPERVYRDVVWLDHRNTDHAWMATTAIRYRVPYRLPVRGGSDAIEARWWPCGSTQELYAALRAEGTELWRAHGALIQNALADEALGTGEDQVVTPEPEPEPGTVWHVIRYAAGKAGVVEHTRRSDAAAVMEARGVHREHPHDRVVVLPESPAGRGAPIWVGQPDTAIDWPAAGSVVNVAHGTVGIQAGNVHAGRSVDPSEER